MPLAFRLFFVIWFSMAAVAILRVVKQLRASGLSIRIALQKAQITVKKAPPAKPQAPGPFLLFAFIGGAIMAGAVWTLVWTNQFIQRAVHTQGQIIGFATRRGSKGETTYAPRTRFQLPNGGWIIFESKTSSSMNIWPRMGSAVAVLYDPQDPAKARLNCFADLWMMPSILFPFGAIFFGIGLAGYRSAKKRTGPAVAASPTLPNTPNPPSGYNIPNVIH